MGQRERAISGVFLSKFSLVYMRLGETEVDPIDDAGGKEQSCESMSLSRWEGMGMNATWSSCPWPRQRQIFHGIEEAHGRGTEACRWVVGKLQQFSVVVSVFSVKQKATSVSQ